MIINKKIGSSPTLVFAQAARKRISEGKNIISMGLGQPDLKTPDFLVKALVKAAKENDKNGYLGSMGLMPLREAIAKDLNSRRNANYSAKQIIITGGAKQAMQLTLFSILHPGDEIIYFTPNYVSYIPQMLMAEPNATPVAVPLDASFNIDFETLKGKITSKTKAIIVNTPHNPTGKVFNKKTLQALSDIAFENKLFTLLDDVYELLIYNSEEIYGLDIFEKNADRTFFINSFSKSHAVPGWRIGYLVAPQNEVSQIVKIQQHMNTNVNSLMQHALLEVYANGFEFLEDYIKELKTRSEEVYRYLKPYLGDNIFKPEGGFFYFLDISKYVNDSNAFCADMMDKVGVAMTPGIAFGEDWNSHVRLSFGVENDRLKEGLEKFSDYLNTYKKKQ